MANWTNNGLSLVATGIQTPGAPAGAAYAGISLGCGTFSQILLNNNTYVNLPLEPGILAPVAAGQQLIVTDGTHTQFATVAVPGAAKGAIFIPVQPFTPAQSFLNGITVVAPVPLASDTGLYNESVRVPVAAGSAGANPGESLTPGYFDGTQPTGVYILVGWFGGSGATSAPGTGILIFEDTQYWSHTLNAESNQFTADSTI